MLKTEYSTKAVQGKEMTVTEYAKTQGITRQAVHYRIKTSGKLPGVIQVKQVGSQVVLVVV